VSDKTNLVPLAKALHEHGAELLSTGGTAKAIKEAGIPVKDVSDYTGFPEMMGGRVKTLHPKVHGGLLMRRGEDDEVAAANGIQEIDMVVINLYPFEDTVAKEGVVEAEAIEQIDMGSQMLRSAAKISNGCFCQRPKIIHSSTNFKGWGIIGRVVASRLPCLKTSLRPRDCGIFKQR
jgi:phosphoribosylaminoimidazolecarboxamide formyltransferase/IMP cyclohydrolase